MYGHRPGGATVNALGGGAIRALYRRRDDAPSLQAMTDERLSG